MPQARERPREAWKDGSQSMTRKKPIRFFRDKDGVELQIHGLYDVEGDETNDPAAARRILVSRPDGKFVVIEVGAGALVSRFTSN